MAGEWLGARLIAQLKPAIRQGFLCRSAEAAHVLRMYIPPNWFQQCPYVGAQIRPTGPSA
jgi:hypothetical protein